MMKNIFKFILLIAAILVLCTACQSKSDETVSTACNVDSLFCSTVDETGEYEIGMFRYPDSLCTSLIDLCPVKYYVSGNKIYTSEKYHFITLTYSFDADTTLAYHHMIFFDRNQSADENGWYSIEIDKNNIPREPVTHISAIALRSYCGDKYDYKNEPHANAFLFNATKEISNDSERNMLSPQLIKLYDIIK